MVGSPLPQTEATDFDVEIILPFLKILTSQTKIPINLPQGLGTGQ